MNDILRMKLPLTSLPPATADEIARVNRIRQEKMTHINVDPFLLPRAFQGFREERMGLGDYPKVTAQSGNLSETLRYVLARA